MVLILGDIEEGEITHLMLSRFETLEDWKERMEQLGELTPEPGMLEHPEFLFFRFKQKGWQDRIISVEFGEEVDDCRNCGAKKKRHAPCENCVA